MIPQRYMEKDAWPHRFTKNSPEYVGEDGVKWQNMVCVSCGLNYVQGRSPKPIGACPARNDKETLKRLGLM